MAIFYNKWKKYTEIQLTKNNGLKQSKYEKLSTLPIYKCLSEVKK